MAEEKKEEKKRIGVAWSFPAAGGGGAAGGAAGAAGLGGKMAVALLLGTLGAGAISLGRHLAPQEDRFKRQPASLASKSDRIQYDVDPSQIPGDRPGRSSLGMVTGSLDGKTPAQRAAEAAAAEAAANAEAEKQAKADAANQPPDAQATTVPADLAAAAAGASQAAEGDKDKDKDKEKKAALPSAFSALGGALGGGGSSGLNGGSGMSGGVGQNFGSKLGAPKGFGSTVTPGRTAARSAARSPSRGKAFSQLQRANALSSQGASSANEASSTAADQAFNNNPGANSAITGGGAGARGGGTPAGTGTSNPTNSGGGGPTRASSGGSGGDDAGTTPAPAPSHKNSTPWQGLVIAAMALLAIASVLLLFESHYAKLAKAGGPTAVANWGTALMLAKIATVVAGLATLIGIAIIAMGQLMQGAMFTIMGGVVTFMAVKALMADKAGLAMAEFQVATHAIVQSVSNAFTTVGKLVLSLF